MQRASVADPVPSYHPIAILIDVDPTLDIAFAVAGSDHDAKSGTEVVMMMVIIVMVVVVVVVMMIVAVVVVVILHQIGLRRL
jgi:hypothetical protein